MDCESRRMDIERLDRELVQILNQRASLIRDQQTPSPSGMLFSPGDISTTHERIRSYNTGPLSDHALHNIYREIFSSTAALAGPVRVSYLGPPGTFTHVASLERFGTGSEYLPASEIRDVFLAVSRGHADFGVVPIENSTEGSVNMTSDMFMESEMKICAEIFCEIHQNLLANCTQSEIKRIASHPQALAQCRNWLAANAASVEIVEMASTTAAARLATTEWGTAAIASEAAATLHELNLLERCIEDRCNNVTRFVVLSSHYGASSGNDRTSLMFSLRHEAGSLAEVLLLFKEKEINLTRIESRPSRRKAWEYTFFIDIQGHADDPSIRNLLNLVEAKTHDFTILGSYPRVVHPGPFREMSRAPVS